MTLRDLLPILIALRDLLQKHSDEQGKHLTFPRFDLGALVALATSTGDGLSSFGPTDVRRTLSKGKQVFKTLHTLGSTLGYTVPFVAPLLAGLNLAGQIPPLRDVLRYLEESTGWKWYRTQGMATGLGAHATMKDVLLRLHGLSMPGKPEREELLEHLLPAAFLADLSDALSGSDAPRAWSKTANIVLFLDGFEDLLHTARSTALLLLDTFPSTRFAGRFV